jgi:hypothetical protein
VPDRLNEKARIRQEFGLNVAERSSLRMKELGQLFEADGRYEFRYGDLNLIVRGDHPEWVLQAASEVLCKTARLEKESMIDELTSLVEFEAATETEVDAARYALKERFEILPQCIVSMGRMDYRWAAEGGEGAAGSGVRRPADQANPRHVADKNDSFLENEPGVDISE